MVTVTGYCTFQDVKDFFNGAPIEDAVSQEKTETLINKYGKKIEKISGRAWRTMTVTDEPKSISTPVHSLLYTRVYPIYLKHTNIISITKLEIFNGSDYDDWIADSGKTEGRGDNYWFDLERGIIYLNGTIWYRYGHDVKVTYTYGETEVDPDAYELNLRYVARHIMAMPRFFNVVPEAKSGKQKESKNENTERILELEDQLGMRFGIINTGAWQ